MYMWKGVAVHKAGRYYYWLHQTDDIASSVVVIGQSLLVV